MTTLFKSSSHQNAELLQPASVPGALARKKCTFSLCGWWEGEEVFLDLGEKMSLGGCDEELEIGERSRDPE